MALGANLSNPKQTFLAALSDLKDIGINCVRASSLWQSPAWPPGSDAPDYLNAVVSLRYDGTPSDLLHILQQVEHGHGRQRSIKNAPRTLDLDILDFRRQQIKLPDLTVPHPRMLSRAFVLFPLAELAPDWRDPVSKKPIEHFIGQLSFTDTMQTIPSDRYWVNV